MTIKQHVSNLRDLIRQYGRNPDPFTDAFLYQILSICRAGLIKQKLDKFVNIDSSNYYTFCMSLEISKSHNCDCVPTNLNCQVLKSKYPIPKAFSSRNKNRLWVKTLGGKVINLIDERTWLRRKDLDTNEYYGSIINNYLVLWNVPLTLKVVEITGLWADPLDLVSIPDCSGDVETGTCFDIQLQEYPLKIEYTKDVYAECLRFLQMQAPQDITNDSNEVIKQ